ncbi:MAG: class I SAM-dependent methyltransferase, partial [Chloroflexi bacterium]|nr:class I SAM-dependent methyltransferase [Chloroflexota bacterium]
MTQPQGQSINFDRAAPIYDATRGFPAGVEADAIAFLAQAGGLTDTSRILEIGVGTGRISLPLSRYVGVAFGMDISKQMLSRLIEKRSDETLHVAQADATRLPLPSDHFDAVLVVHVLHLIPNWREALDELRRVLKPGSALLMAGGGGWYRDANIAPLREAFVEASGQDKLSQVGLSWEDQDDEFTQLGWQREGERHSFHFTGMGSPARLIAMYENRVFSSCWPLSDAQVAAGVKAMRALAAERFDDLETEFEIASEFGVEIYRYHELPSVSSPPPKPAAAQRKPFEPEMVLIPAGPFLMGSPLSDSLR